MKASGVFDKNGEHISMPERLLLLAILGTTVVGSYTYLNQYPIFSPQTLPLTRVDTAIPFLVWTVGPYVFLNLSNALMPFFIRLRSEFRRMAATLAIAMAIHILFWTFWPTTFLRPPVPIGDTFSEQLYRSLISVDTPLNCFPSAHISAPAIQLYFVGRAWPKFAPWLWFLYFVLSVTVLTTKQHYIWDVIGAAAIVLLAFKMTGGGVNPNPNDN